MDEVASRETFENARRALLDERCRNGCWEGELSASALSTATAVFALQSVIDSGQAHSHAKAEALPLLAAGGLAWLAANQNDDGGWGDTVRSFSNISTTALCWAALAKADKSGEYDEAASRAKAWLENTAGSLDPARLASAISHRYGKDRTFSVPILTTLALAGKLGEGRAAWRHIAQLPFELAMCPHRWFQVVRLPVVSYALPALIAMGQVRHKKSPSLNPAARLIRNWSKRKTLRVLESIQPGSGGFLEAAPLTSFVVLSLVGAGETQNPVVKEGVKFLLESVRPDGSWPIDTNLATWVTTLSVNALAASGELHHSLDKTEIERIVDWLLDQQYRVEHPYTHAAPGGWAWTDLTGGVPDADDTPGALLALHHLAPGDERVHQAATAGVCWLLDLHNRDGGMPTFCRGWGALPFDRSSPDLTAHAIRAWLVWRNEMPQDVQRRIDKALHKAVRFLSRRQNAEGAWAPLWFGNQHLEVEENLTYGTSRVLLAIAAMDEAGIDIGLDPVARQAAVDWLVGIQNEDGGWGGDRNTPSSVEETALAVEGLCAIAAIGDQVNANGNPSAKPQLTNAIEAGASWLHSHTKAGRAYSATPIGFYFAKLWYFERLYPCVFTVAALARRLRIR